MGSVLCYWGKLGTDTWQQQYSSRKDSDGEESETKRDKIRHTQKGRVG